MHDDTLKRIGETAGIIVMVCLALFLLLLLIKVVRVTLC